MENITEERVAVPKKPAKTVSNLAEENARTRKYLVSGALWTLGGFTLLVITLIRSSGTRGHVIVWAAFLLGGVQFVRGLARLKRTKKKFDN